MNRSKEDLTIKEVDCIICETEMIWDDETREWVCPECGNRAFQTYDCGLDEIYYERSPDDDYDKYYED